METLKFLFLASLCWQTFRVARGQTAASCSVTVGGNAASVTLNSSSDGTFECSLDGGSFEQCISGDVFGDLVAGIHSISIQFIPAGSPQILNCLPLSNFTISTPGFTFAVAASYVGNNIVLAIDSSSEGVFCCQLDIGTCILCMDGFQFSNVSSGVHSIVVRGSSVSEPQRVNSVQLEVSDFSFTAEPLGSTITVHITSSVDAAFRCRLDNNEFIPCFSGYQFRGVSGGQHFIQVERAIASDPATVLLSNKTVGVSDRVVSFSDIQTNVNIASNNYTFTFTVNEKPSDLNITLLLDGAPLPVPHWCHSITGNTCYCTFSLSGVDSVALGEHNVTFQALLDGTVFGEVTATFLVVDVITVKFKDDNYFVKEDDAAFNVTIQIFGEVSAPFDLRIRTRASNPTSAQPGTDYPSAQQAISLTPQSASVQIVEIPVFPDYVFETDETFVLIFNVRSSVRSKNDIEFNNEAQVTILDDDVVFVNLQDGSANPTEGGNYSVLVSVKPTNLTTNFDVNVETYMCGECLAAIPDLDYIPVKKTVTLGPENTSEEITITILEDIYDEADNEVVCLRLILPEDNQAIGTQLAVSMMNFTIMDDNSNVLDLTVSTNSTSYQNETSYTINVFYNAGTPATFNCRLNDQDFSSCMLPHVYSDIPYGIYTIEVRAMSDTATVAIEQKVLLVEANIEVINGSTITLHIQSTKPAVYNCMLNDGDYFSCDDQYVISDLDRGNYTLTVEATSTDDSSQLAYTIIGPVLVFGSGITNGQSAASLCSGYAEYFSMGVFYTASWRARESIIEFIVTGNVSDEWLGIGFTDKQMMKFDIITGATDNNGSYFIDDRYSVTRGKIFQDSQQDIEDFSISHSNGTTTLRFSRHRNTGDENDFSLDVCRYFLFAWGDVIDILTGEIGGHGFGRRFISDTLICIPTSTSLCPRQFDCGVPGRPTNGQVSFGSTVEGSVANYGCDFGYDLVGASQRRCTSGDNLWSGNVPECRIVDCGSPGRLLNGVSNFTSTTYDSVVTHTCDEGFVLCGMESRMCQSNGMWSSSLPSCIRVIVTVNDGSRVIQINENRGPVNISLSLDQPSCHPITIVATPQVRSPPSATVDDFDNMTVTVVVNPGETRATVSIEIVDDDRLEGEEFFDVAFEIGGTNIDGAVIGEPELVQVAISSEDVVTVSFTEREYSISEGAGSVRIGLQLNRVIDQMFTVQVEMIGITAEGNGVDFDSNVRSVIFLPGAITSFSDIPITDDPIAEPTENFTLSISIPLQLLGVIPGDPSTATGFIMDDDVDCGDLMDITNGEVDFTTTYGGSVATYSCNEGYVLCGSENRTCQSNGSWSGSPPECIRVTVTVDDSMRYMVNEDEGPVNITILLDQPSCVPVTVIARPQVRSPPSATEGDFDVSPVTVMINPGVTRAMASITITNNNRLETLKFFDVALSIGMDSNGAITGQPNMTEVVILSEDMVTVTFTEREYSAREDAGSIRVGVQLSRQLQQRITVVVTMTGISADGNGIDFDSRSSSVIIPRGNTTRFTDIQIIDDNITEPTENFSLSLQVNMDIGIVIGDPATATGFIIDNDVVVVSFTEREYSISEGAGSVRIGLHLNRVIDQIITVQVEMIGITAEGNGVDFDSNVRSVIFLPGAITSFTDIPITDDPIAEPTENFTLSISIPLQLIGVIPGDPSTATGFIMDDDVDCGDLMDVTNGEVDFTTTYGGSVATYSCNEGYVLCGPENRTCQSNGSWSGSPPECIRVTVTVDDSMRYMVNEDEGPVNITILLDQPSCVPVTVIARPQVRSPPSATEGDFDVSPVTVMINPGVTRAMASITITNNNRLETLKFFDVALSIGMDSNGAITGQPNMTEVVILSEDMVTVTFTEREYSAREDAGLIRVGVQLSRQLQQRITVVVTMTGISADGNGIDFDSRNRSITIPRGSTTRFTNIQIIDDDITEPTENFSLSLQVNMDIGIVIGDPATATALIIDNDVNCGDPEIPANGDVRFTDTTEGNVADYSCNEGYDLSGVTQRICQSNSTWSESVPTCEIVNCGPLGTPQNGNTDVTSTTFGSVAEHVCNDGFLLCGSENRTCQSDGSWSGTLPECIKLTVTFEDTTYTVNEDAGAVEIKLLLDQPSCLPINVIVQPVIRDGDSSIVASMEDFNISRVVAQISPGDTEHSVFIEIFNDMNLEQTELFDVRLDGITADTSTGVTLGSIQRAEVTIVDSDMLTVRFTQQQYNVDENEQSVMVGLQLGRPAGVDVTVGVRPVPDTAQGNMVDFDSVRRTVIFGPADTIKTLNISIVDDSIVESQENFTLIIQLSRATVRLGVERGNPSQATVIINDDDIDCGDLMNVTSGEVDFTTTYGGSVATYSCNEGYVLCGSENRTCQSNGSWSGSPPECIRVTVTVDDSMRYMVNEDEGPVNIAILLDQPSCVPITVIARPQATNAKKSDFNTRRVVVVVNPGETRATVSIPIVNDNRLEVPETFRVVLSIDQNSEGAVVGQSDTAEVVILSDDTVTVRFAQAQYTANEGEGIMRVGVRLSRRLQQSITVRIVLMGISAEGSGTDFNSSTVEVEFRRRTMGRNVIIPIIDDDINEPLENFSLAIELDPQLSNMGVIIGEPAVATGFIIDDDEEVCLSNGIEYQNGDIFQPNCTARCICEGSDVNCRYQDCPLSGSTCTAYGDPHYTTYDARQFDFQGTCEYILSQPCDGNDFIIIGINTPVRRNPLASESTSTRIIIPGKVEILLQRKRIFIDGMLQPNIGDGPVYSSDGVEVSRTGGQTFVMLSMRFPVGIFYDARRRIRITVSDRWQGMLCGLCGNHNDDPSDDFILPDGSMTTSENIFASSWEYIKNPPDCETPQLASSCPTDLVQTAQTRCGVLRTGAFAVCNSVVDPTALIESCVFDYCNCAEEDREECYCDAISTYPTQCAANNVVIASSWRTPTLCPSNCSDGMVYQQCGQVCSQTCQTVNTGCIGGCIDGCFCPVGQVFSEGRCIDVDDCSLITCPLLIDSPNNGMINCSLGDDGQPNPGDTCSYTCNTGFVLDGNTIRTCQNDATWSDTEPFCRPVVTVSFTEREYNISEGAGLLRIGLQLNTSTDQTITVQVEAIGITAEGNGVDYDSNVRNVTFLPGAITSFTDIPITDDPIAEPTENFTLSISIPLQLLGVIPGDPSTATGFIMDDDVDCGDLMEPANGEVDFTTTYGGSVATYSCNEGYVLCRSENRTCQSNGSWSGSPPECIRVTVTVDDSMRYMVNEDEGPVNITILLDQPSCVPITVIARPQVRSPPSATVDDFDNMTVTVVVNPGETRATVSIEIMNDDRLEGEETFDVVLEAVDIDGVVIGEPSLAQVFVTSEDVVTVSFTEREYSISEGAGSVRIGLQLNRVIDQMFTVQVEMIGITAEGNGVDFDSNVRSVTFLPGAITSFTDIPITDDPIAEPTENFTLSISIPLQLLSVIPGDPSTATGFIMDDDVDCGDLMNVTNGEVDFTTTYGGSVATYSCNEGYVLCGSENRTCQSNGSWSGSPPECIRVTVTVDDSMRYMVNEDEGPVNITILLDQPSCVPITVIARPQVRSPPSATVDDFDNMTVTVVVNPGETRATISIEIVDDDRLEGEETFDVILEAVDIDGVVIGEPSLAQVFITSEDVVIVSFTEREYSISEGVGSVRIGLQLNRVIDQMFTVQVEMIGITAEGNGVDFDSNVRSVTFLPGAITSFTDIPITDDPIAERTENFTLSISIPLQLLGVILGDPSTATGFIMDDDVECGDLTEPANGEVDFTTTYGGSVATYSCSEGYVLCGPENRTCQSNGSWSGSPPECIRVTVTVDDSMRYMVNEDEGPVNITILLDQPSCVPITVIARPQAANAKDNDFNISPVIVVFSPGQTRAIASIPITNDDRLEEAERFSVALSIGMDSNGATIGSSNVTEVVILSEDMVIVSFIESEYMVREGARRLRVGLQLNRGLQQRISVRVVLIGITAEGNMVDFDSSRRSVTFNRRSTREFFNVPIIDDDISEPLENFSLAIEIISDNGVVLGDPAVATGFIIDNDVDCGNPEIPANGDVRFTNTTEGSVTDYSCDEGYDLNGVTQRVCQRNSTWSESVPTCEIVNCGPLGTPQNGNTDVTNTTFGSVAEHECNDGFLLCGSENRTCQSNGSWSGSLPECIQITITFEDTTYTVNEDAGAVEIKLLLDQPSCLPINVIVQPVIRDGDSSIVASMEDFNISRVVVRISPGDTEHSVFIQIFNDMNLEQTELFDVTLNSTTADTSTGVTLGSIQRAEVTIVDSDMLTVRFTQQQYSVNENEQSVMVGLQLSRPAGVDVTIGVRLVPDTAQGNMVDFDSARSTVMFGPTDTIKTLNISIVDDSIVESQENFTLMIQLSRATARLGVERGSPSEATVVITDDDMVSVNFTEREYSISEGAGSMRIGLQLNRRIDQIITVQFEIIGITAEGNGVDFDANVRSVIFLPGAITAFSDIPITDDPIAEPTENFTLSISIPLQLLGVIPGDPSTATGFIMDDDVDCGDLMNVTNGEVDFITTYGGSVATYSCNEGYVLCGSDNRTCQSNGSWSGSPPECIRVTVTVDDSMRYMVNEDEGPVNITILLDQPSCVPVTVIARPQVRSPPSATVDDFDNTTVTVVVNPGETRATISIEIVDDDRLEAEETFDVILEVGDIDGVVIGEPSLAQVFITSEDVVTVSFTEREYSISEGAGSVRIGLQLNRVIDQTITVQVEMIGITAEGNGVDFDSNVRSVTFLPGAITSFSDIPITDDPIAEPTENFTLSISIPLQLLGVIPGDPSTATGFIMDDDVDCGNLMNVTNGEVDFSTTYGGSVATYSCNEGYVLCGSENRTCQPNGSWSGSPPECIRVTVTVDDSMRYMVNEDEGPVNITILLDQPSCVPVTVIARPQVRSPPSATEGDFDVSPVTVMINPGETRAMASITITNNNRLETLKFFDVALSIGMESNGAIIGQPNMTEVVILSEDMVTVTFTEREYSVREDSGLIRVGVQLSRQLQQRITVVVTMTGISADGNGIDFDSRSRSIIIPRGNTTRFTDIQIIDDNITEPTENFSLSLQVNMDIGIVIGDPATATASIIDNDVVTVNFTEREYSISEGAGSVRIGLQLNRVIDQIITVQVEMIGITAEGNGVDFDSNVRSVTFLPGAITSFSDIPITDDPIAEPTENFTLSISIPLQLLGVISGDPSTATGFIMDDDVDCGDLINVTNGEVDFTTTYGGSVATYSCNEGYILCGSENRTCQSNGSWSGSPPECIRVTVTVDDSMRYMVNEDEGPVNITILLDQPSCVPITVIARPQTANAKDNDFNINPVTVVFSPGQTRAIASIPITNDGRLEEAERFSVALSIGMDSNGATIGSSNVTEVVILSEDMVIVSFIESEYMVREGARRLRVGLQLNRGLQQRISVRVVLTGISAEGNMVDFDSSRRNIVFNRRSTREFFNVPIIDDDISEPLENFSLAIEIISDNGVVLGDPAVATGFIIDNDVNCGDPGSPIDGDVSFTTTTEGSVADYSCNEGYDLNGVTQRTCQRNSTWSESVPTCEIVNCGPLGTPQNGNTDVTNTTFGSMAEHECNDGFLLCGSENRTCQSNGSWSGSLPECIKITITLEDTTYTVIEDTGAVEIKLLLDRPSCLPINVIVQPVIRDGDSSIVASREDFNTSAVVAQISPGDTEHSVFIPIFNDMNLEQTELFEVTLNGTTADTSTGVTLGSIQRAEVTIVDRDMLTVRFTQQQYSVNENEQSVMVGLQLSRPAGVDVTVGVRPVPDTAQGDIDFDSARSTVMFGPTDTIKSLNISIVDDSIVESQENFTLMIQLGRAAVRLGVERGSPSEATVIINDDDRISVEFEQTQYTVVEGAGSVEICLLSDGQNNVSVVVDVQPQETVPQSAAGLSDYPTATSMLQFGPGEAKKCFNQAITNDVTPEGTEMFDLVILPNEQILASNSRSQVVIIDDDDSQQRNDTVIGDPLYTVPLQISKEMTVDVPEFAELSLCYEIHGRANEFFNLVSDHCVSISAEYVQSANNENLNFIKRIGVLAVDNNGDCQRITVDSDGCSASVNTLTGSQVVPYSAAGVSIRKSGNHYRIAVPNCELQDLVIWVICDSTTALKFVIMRGFNLQPTSHGLVAQFWNIPVELSPFTGDTPDDFEYYTVKVTPADGDVREFVGYTYDVTWDFTKTPCVYAGNQQGGVDGSFIDSSDSIIEGRYTQYIVDSLFDTEYDFTQFNSSQCLF